MKIEDAKQNLLFMKDAYDNLISRKEEPLERYIELSNSCAAALEVIQAEQEREKGCKYCENVPSRYKGIMAEAFEQIAADDERVVGIDVNYCPMCGRKLGENDGD